MRASFDSARTRTNAGSGISGRAGFGGERVVGEEQKQTGQGEGKTTLPHRGPLCWQNGFIQMV